MALLRSVDLSRGTRRFQRFVTLGGSKPSGEPPRSRGVLDPQLLRTAAAAGRAQARPAAHGPQPGHVRGRDHGCARDAHRPRQPHRPPAGQRPGRPGLPGADRPVALVHGPLRHLRRGRRRGARPRAGRDAAADPLGDHGPSAACRRLARGRRLVGAAPRRHRRRLGGRDHPRRRRRHRGRRLRQRGRHHRRIGARAQGAGHRHPQLGDGWHDARQRPHRRARHGRPGRDLPRSHDRPRGGRDAGSARPTRSPSPSCWPA